jgi:cellobiose phosphorylase
MKHILARELLGKPQEMAQQFFGELITETEGYDYQFTDASLQNLLLIGRFTYQVPAFKELYKDEMLAVFFDSLSTMQSHLFQIAWDSGTIIQYTYDSVEKKDKLLQEKSLPEPLASKILNKLMNYKSWAGYLDEFGDHIIDLKAPSPGAHFYTNMLLGKRIGFSLPLQSTPKSVVDRLGGGSFRAHAANQVLATRWDMLPEENGFPANRQFYLVEEGKQIFYSADATDSNVLTAVCRHSRNHTRLEYSTACGLLITRTIFLLPQYQGLPMATEVQRITIRNTGKKERKLKVVLTGMIASAVPPALMEDVVYSTVIMESGILNKAEGQLLAYVPHYYPDYCQGDVRFGTAMFYEKGKKTYPGEIGTHYGDFIGSGSLNRPQGLSRLTNRLSTKGPGFLALGKQFYLAAGEEVTADQYTGLITELQDTAVSKETLQREIENLHSRFTEREALEEALSAQMNWYDDYRSYLQVSTGNRDFNAYVNYNLPFQVLYQTFVSRSFDLTQKGYREIGFREIQDIYASMYYFMAMGEGEYTKSLLREWIEKVLEFGYCYHNFFWKGKEAGKWSDDGLWLVQAVYRYVQFSKDTEFLKVEYEIPESGGKKRKVYDTLKAVIHYSGTVSIGNHGLPLIDFADWNDCLKVDPNYLTGKEKETLTGPVDGYSESVMNGFLLKLAINHMEELSFNLGDLAYREELKHQKQMLSRNLQEHAWKGDFFARVLFNRYGDKITYLGAGGDGFSRKKEIPGTYFLNSFSWSVLSGEATEEQIGIMLEGIQKYLISPFGFPLMSPTDLSRVAQATATGEYFPGDRENGGIFKHATMMAAAAMVKASKEAEDIKLAVKLRDLAYWMVNLVLPFKTLENPFMACGNPRWCTQYINSQTGENIGPTLSGTSTWLTLTLFEMLGIEYRDGQLLLNPMLSEEEEELRYTLKHRKTYYEITVRKPVGLSRIKEGGYRFVLDGRTAEGNAVPLIDDGKFHRLELEFVK